MAELTASFNGETHQNELHETTPVPCLQENFDLDDAFTADDDEISTSFHFDPDSFSEELKAKSTLGASEELPDSSNGGDIEEIDLQNGSEAAYNSAEASVSTLDIGLPAESNASSTSSRSTNSEIAAPTTPTDYSDSPARNHSQPASVTLPPSPSVSLNDQQPRQIYPSNSLVTQSPKYDPAEIPASHHSSGLSSISSYEANKENILRRSSLIDINQYQGSDSSSLGPSVVEPISAGMVHQSKPSSSTTGQTPVNRSSTFQKIVSKTRPPHLPPKPVQEDVKHAKEWEAMMQRSRMTEQKRQKELQARRLAREQAVEANIALWESTVVPDWKKALRDPNLRKLWWNGVPTKLRSTMWERAVGNALALDKNSFATSSARAKNLLASRRFPTTALSLIESDIATTLPHLHIFNRHSGPLHDDLYNLLCAWVVSRADEGLGYVEGVAKIGGMLLLNLTGPPQAFIVMRNLLERSCLRAFYGGHAAQDDVEAYYRIFDTLLADGMPKIYFNFKQHQISPSEYLKDWLLPLFLNHLPLEACTRIWDVLLLEGDSFLFRAALAILASIESRLFFPDRKELIDVLKGESRAALEVAKRSPWSPTMTAFGNITGTCYEIYGLNEENVWERIMEMAEWWKDSTWQRLIVRELPDL